MNRGLLPAVSFWLSPAAHKERRYALAAIAGLFGLASVLAALVSIRTGVALCGVLLALILVGLLQLYSTVVRSAQEIEKQQHSLNIEASRQMQALLYVYSAVRLRRPLPGMRDMAISPDFAATLVSQILERHPKNIVELGSGTSTLLSAYCLEQIGDGKLLSLDHEQKYGSTTAAQLSEHQLDHIGQVQHAPLERIQLDSASWEWYDLTNIPLPESIDLLVIDGPPANPGKLTRYPALPVFYDRLSPSAMVILDDAARADEQSIVERWLKEYPVFSREYLLHEKGTAILRRRSDGVR